MDYAANLVRQIILNRLRSEQEAEATHADKLLSKCKPVKYFQKSDLYKVEQQQCGRSTLLKLNNNNAVDILVEHLDVEMCIVGNHIVHTLEMVVYDVARMVEMRMGSDGKFVTCIGFVCMFVMGMGYDMMVAMVAHKVDLGCRMVAHMLEIVYVCLPVGQGQTIFGIGHVCGPVDYICYNVYFLAPHLEIVYDLYFWDDLAIGCPFEVE
ncbi:hypothetical protein Tco_0678639 [Tanacetum coccineum]|uniref:Uncharacterized protein n=1 Tax=Tanacetum coccineum TaxID=301880 RepID=A0ABQ4XGT9_9ASTR